MAGAVVHFEIPADDPERAQGCYREAFGWGVDPMPDMSYAMLRTVPVDGQGRPVEPGAINGGMLQRQGVWQAPLVVIDVEDIPAALAEVQRLGGATVREMTPVGEMGFAAYFTDTEGNLMGLWQSAPG